MKFPLYRTAVNMLKHIEMEMQVEFWRYKQEDNIAQGIIDEMQDALNHIAKALDILEGDDL